MCNNNSSVAFDFNRNGKTEPLELLAGLLITLCKQQENHRPHHGHCPQPGQHQRPPMECFPPMPRPDCPQNDCDSTNPSGNYSGEVSVWGDPHVNGSVSNGSETTTNIHFDTRGGAGDTINLLDSSGRNSLDVQADFISWHGSNDVTVVGQEHIQLNNHEIDIKPGELTIDGQKMADGKYCYYDSRTGGYNTIEKCGNTVTIKTAAGETLTVVDKGGYLDTSLKLDHYQGQLGGMLGDAINGHADANAEHYNTQNMNIMDGAGGYGYGGGWDGWNNALPTQDMQWATGILMWLSQMLQSQGCDMSQFSFGSAFNS